MQAHTTPMKSEGYAHLLLSLYIYPIYFHAPEILPVLLGIF